MNASNTEFAQLIDKARWTQAHAAESLGLAQSTISRYLEGSIEVPLSVLLALRALRTPRQAPKEETLKEETVDPSIDLAERGLLEDLRLLDPNAKSRVIGAFRQILWEAPKQRTDIPRPGPKSSVTASGVSVGAEVEAAVAAAEPGRAPLYRRSTKAASTSGRKPVPSRGGRRGANAEPSVPTPVPDEPES